MGRPLQVLLIEDNENDAELVLHELRRGGYEPTSERVWTAEAMAAALDRRAWDMVICDHHMPQFDSMAAMNLLRDRGHDVPFIIVSGVMEQEVAVQAMRAGAHDYLAKGDLSRLLPAIERELRETESRRERQETERALREAEEVFRALSASSMLGIFMMDAGGNLTYANPNYRKFLGLTLAESLGRGWLQALPPEYRERSVEAWDTFVRDGGRGQYSCECHLQPRSDKVLWVQVRAFAMRSEGGQSTGFVGTLEDITERKQAEEALRESEERFRSLVENAHDAIFSLSPDGMLTSLSPAFETITGWSRDEWLGRNFAPLVHREDLPRALAHMQRVLQCEAVSLLEARVQAKDGRYVVAEFTCTPQRKGDKVVGVLGIARDITQRRGLEHQLRQAQKVEAVGRLAGGIAHDFNNMLTAILGYSDLILQRVPANDPVRANVDEIHKAAERAATLTGQLLAFSRKQTLETKVFDLRQVVGGVERMLQRLIGEDVKLITELGDVPANVKADHGQIEQVVMNLVVNARDAMPHGGKITIQLVFTTLDEEYARQQEGVNPGEHVLLVIADTGTGMTEEVKAHLFEPFFTTKAQGKGTGLGLATCYGIIKQSGGHITVQSELGRGTTFLVYLPRLVAAPAEVPRREEFTDLPKGNERGLSRENLVLRELGYQVLTASNGEVAMRLMTTPGRKIDLLLTDVVMPQMGGHELADRLRSLEPGLRVLFTSGYTDSTIVHQGLLDPHIAFLQKPYVPATLACKVREVLDS